MSSRLLPMLLCAAMLCIAACAPRIGLKTDFSNQGFEIGRTTKSDVVNGLGLPQKILKDHEGREHLFYAGSTKLVGMCVGCGMPNAPVGLIPSMMNEAAMSHGAEYVFDEKGVLAAKFEPPPKGK